MKRFIFLLSFALLSNLIYAQISDDDAKQLYHDAEEQYEAGYYNKCFQMCNDLISKMGKPNPKILYLSLKAAYNSLEGKNDKSEYTLKKNYNNYVKFSGYADAFFSLVDKNNYPADKFNEMLEIQKYLNTGIKDYEHEKDRKPEDAIDFLNACAKQFPYKRAASQYATTLNSTTLFRLDSPYLRIIQFSEEDNSYRKRGATSTLIMVTIIDLGKITDIECSNKTFQGSNYTECRMRGEQLKTYTSSGEENIYTKGVVRSFHSATKSNGRWDKNQPFGDYESLFADTATDSQTAIANWEASNFLILRDFYKFDHGILFDETTPAFQEGDYQNRIKDAFQFLIDYYPKTQAAKPKRNSKF